MHDLTDFIDDLDIYIPCTTSLHFNFHACKNGNLKQNIVQWESFEI